ncbi:Trafficking protein particle complex subunit 31 [Cystobasidiomycetes sp. EMM_F5]
MANPSSFYNHSGVIGSNPNLAASAGISRYSTSSPSPSATNAPSNLSNAAAASSSSSAFSSLSKRMSTVSGSSAITSQQPVNIVDRNLGKTRGAEVAYGAWAFLFSEIVTYTQKRINSISDFEARLSLIGYRVGVRLVELLPLRESLPPSTSRANAGPTRHTRLLPVLHYVHTTLFKYLFGRPASSLEKSTEADDEYMIGDDEPVLDRGIQVPKDMAQLNTNALLAGVVEAVMDGLGFPSRVTAHLVPSDQHPRRTVLLIKLNRDVMQREQALAGNK